MKEEEEGEMGDTEQHDGPYDHAKKMEEKVNDEVEEAE